MKKLNNNQKLLDKLNAQFAEELGFDVMLRDMTDYLMDKIGMTGQCAVGEDELPGVYEMIADDLENLDEEDVELVLGYFSENDCIRIEEIGNTWIVTLTKKLQKLHSSSCFFVSLPHHFFRFYSYQVLSSLFGKNER